VDDNRDTLASRRGSGLFGSGDPARDVAGQRIGRGLSLDYRKLIAAAAIRAPVILGLLVRAKGYLLEV
jgi:hypothetical protein